VAIDNKTLNISNIFEEAFLKLLRGDGKELDAYLSKVIAEPEVLDTKAKVHCYIVAHDGQDQPRIKDLAQAIAARIIDYAIPRNELKRAQEYDIKFNTTSEVSKLKLKAKKLFTTLGKTGEGGEMLLYMLIQNYLKLPQILCKMSLKTNSELHYNGADAIHMIFDSGKQKMALYWGESKMYQSLDTAVTSCLESIKPFLCDDGGSNSRQMRDLQLITDNLDLSDEILENVMLKYLNPDDPLFNKLEYRGACFIGFDHGVYSSTPNTKTEQEVISEVESIFSKWQNKIGKKIKESSPLHSFVLEIFLIPFPSVEGFRKEFLSEIKNG
jgi:hypothetical protein